MSVAVFESTSSSAAFGFSDEQSATQLVFDFEAKDREVRELETEEFEPAAEASSSKVWRQPERMPADSTLARRGLAEKAKLRGLGQQQPEQVQAGRVGSDVRIGTVMLQLLKSYGITDEEIAAGLESYAKKNCSRKAS